MSGTRLVLATSAGFAVVRMARAGAARRTRRARVRALVTLGAGHPRPFVVWWAAAIGAGEGLGRRVRRLAHRPADPERDRRVGLAGVVGLVVALFAGPPAGLAALFLVWALPVVRSRRRARRRAALVVEEVPDVVDLFRLAIGAGLNVRLSISAVARHGRGVIIDELVRADQCIDRGDRVADVLAGLAAAGDLGPAVRPLLDALLATERYGAPIGPSLERAADDARLRRRRSHEEQARRIPVRLLFPLVCCTLPALGLLTVVPALVRSIPSFGF